MQSYARASDPGALDIVLPLPGVVVLDVVAAVPLELCATAAPLQVALLQHLHRHSTLIEALGFRRHFARPVGKGSGERHHHRVDVLCAGTATQQQVRLVKHHQLHIPESAQGSPPGDLVLSRTGFQTMSGSPRSCYQDVWSPLHRPHGGGGFYCQRAIQAGLPQRCGELCDHCVHLEGKLLAGNQDEHQRVRGIRWPRPLSEDDLQGWKHVGESFA
mmetsp:Transcript_66757/g.159669  ORF Transcript_66757/g.159669 Transcript_66757/m.159669 type:complete len:216 (-) Transcript_66757:608-1255(-)